MSDIFHEVDEAMQKEKLLNIWNEYKNTIIAAIAILILSASLTSAYHSWNTSRNQEETAKLLQAFDSREPAKELDILFKESRKSQAAIAGFTKASIAISEGEKEKAATTYAVIVEDRSTPRDLRDLARILYVQNAAKPEFNILKPLLANDKSPWIWHARIEAAALYASQEDYNKALSYLQEFENVNTIPTSIKERGLALLHVYKMKAQTKTKADEEEPIS